MVKKNEVKEITIRDFEDVNKSLAAIASLESEIAKREAEMNAQIQKIRDHFDSITIDARNEKFALEKSIEIFCISQKHEFEKTRSRELFHGIIKFSFNPPKLMLLNRKYNWDTVIELLSKLKLRDYIRVKEEVNKESILADYSQGNIKDEKLAAVGLKVDQIEKFSYEIKWDSISETGALKVA